MGDNSYTMTKAQVELIEQIKAKIAILDVEIEKIPEAKRLTVNQKWYIAYMEKMDLHDAIRRTGNLRVSELKPELLCGCQEGMVGPEHCPVHGASPYPLDEWCKCDMPTADSVTEKAGTCAECGKVVRVYEESMDDAMMRLGRKDFATAIDRAVMAAYPAVLAAGEPGFMTCATAPKVSPAQGGCWFCQKNVPELDLFSGEFDTYLHAKCLVEAVKRERHQETMIFFNEVFMGEGDELLEPGTLCTGRCFELSECATTKHYQWFEIESVELLARRVLPGELIMREKGSNFNPQKCFAKGVQE